MNELLVVDGVSKSFPGVKALNDVKFDVIPGEVHALCGENGAGKSTLMRILAGRTRPDSGSITYHNMPYVPRDPNDARGQGVILVHQEISLVPEMTVAENIYLGAMPTRFGLVNRRKLFENARNVLELNGLDIDPSAKAGSLSISQQQMVEIARASAFPCSVVIFDEPTATLTELEAQSVFKTIERLKRDNVAVIYISHKMKEIFSLSNRITVLRDGDVRDTVKTSETDEETILRLMIGRSPTQLKRRAKSGNAKTLLELVEFSVPGYTEGTNLTVSEGEIVGLYGLVGAGRSELLEGVFGARASVGTVKWHGKPVTIANPKAATNLGIGMVPEDRKLQGLVLPHGARDNIALPNLSGLSKLGLINGRKSSELYDKSANDLNLSCPSQNTPVVTLSGGNQQKVVLAKWLATKPELLILDEPTRGIDVGAKHEIYQIINDLVEQGVAILLVSSEMSEIVSLSDRVITMHEGRLTAEFDRDEVNEETLIRAVMPQKNSDPESADASEKKNATPEVCQLVQPSTPELQTGKQLGVSNG